MGVEVIGAKAVVVGAEAAAIRKAAVVESFMVKKDVANFLCCRPLSLCRHTACLCT